MKFALIFAWLLGAVAPGVPCSAQTPAPPLPPGLVRHASAASHVVFYAPDGWTAPAPGTTALSGPNGETIRVGYEAIPDGYDLTSYLSATVKGLRGAVGDAEPPVARHTRLSGLDAREFDVESLTVERGRLHLRIALAVRGPHAVAIVLAAPPAAAAAGDDAFAAVADSLVLVENPKRLAALDAACAGPFAPTGSVALAERAELVRAVDGTDEAARAAAVSGLAAYCRKAPRAVADLLLDARPVVRAAAVDAIAASGLAPDDDLLFFALGDDDASVKERAGRALARAADPVALLRARFGPSYASPDFLRVAALLLPERRVALASELFVTPVTPAVPPAPPAPKSTIPPPPPPSLGPSRESVALALLDDVPSGAGAVPYDRVLATKDDALLAQALGVSERRGDAVPLDLLLRSLASANQEVFENAAFNLARLATPADVSRIEAARDATRTDRSATLDHVVASVRLRAALARAGAEERRRLVDAELGRAKTVEDRLWIRTAEDEAAPKPRAAGEPGWLDRADLGALGENAYPSDVTLYAAAPSPSAVIERMYTSLQGVQLGTARDQARLAFMLATGRERLALALGTSGADFSFERLGVAPRDPLSVAVWSPYGSGDYAPTRAAAVVRVVDRERFERLVSLASERADGLWSEYPVSAAAVVRMVSLMPAFGPIAAIAALGPKKATSPAGVPGGRWRPLPARFVRDETYRGLAFKVFERRSVASTGSVLVVELCLAYAGDRAILASGVPAMHDVLDRLADRGASLASSPNFRAAAAAGGDVIYCSALESAPGGATTFAERGALRVSDDGWENSFHLSIPSAGEARGLEAFLPADAAAPRELLPRSTVAYAIGRCDVGEVWRTWYMPSVDRAAYGAFAAWYASAGVDLQRDVLPELGTEVGAALLDVPSMSGAGFVPTGIVLFVKLREGGEARLAGPLARVFERASATPLPADASHVHVVLKNGYLVLASDEATLARLDEPERLASSPDYVRTAARMPSRVFAFGGYSPEAAFDRIERELTAPDARDALDAVEAVARAFPRHGAWVAPAASGGAGELDAVIDVRLDHDGSHLVSDLAAKNLSTSFATVEAGGEGIALQERLDLLTIRIRSKAAGTIGAIREDVASDAAAVDAETASDLVVTARPRRPGAPAAVTLPVTDAALAPYLAASHEVRSDAESVRATARTVAGTDTDAWSVARKLAAWTHTNLKWKRVDDADAAETLATREADCLEFSELYVAMARSVGLPSRIVHGVAYSGGSFGGHAWVEVWAGRWIELDPTWGTEFVDATHVRESTSVLLNYAVLGLVEIDVVDAHRAVSDDRRDATRLVTALCDDLSEGSTDVLADALDPEAIADEALGPNGWRSLDERGRRAVLGGYAGLASDARYGLAGGSDPGDLTFRVASVAESGDRATALVVGSGDDGDYVSRLTLARRDGAWSIVEVEALDAPVRTVEETMRPAFETVRARRSSADAPAADYSGVARAFARSNASFAQGLAAADEELAKDPSSPLLRYLRAMSLDALGRHDEAVKVYEGLAVEASPLPASVFMLAESLGNEDKPDDARRVALYERYAALEPADPRPHARIADLVEDSERAEREYRAALALDPRSDVAAVDLADLLVARGRLADAVAVVDGSAAFEKGAGFDALLDRLYYEDDDSTRVALVARTYAERVRASADASCSVGRAYNYDGKSAEAVPYFERAIELEPADTQARISLVDARLALHQWRRALAEADAAVAHADKSAAAHLDRACALAQLGRATAAMAELRRAIELDEDYANDLADDVYLRPLSRRADFRGLLPKPSDSGEGP